MKAASWHSTAAAHAASVSSEVLIAAPRSIRLHDDCAIPARSAAFACVRRSPVLASNSPFPIRLASAAARIRPSFREAPARRRCRSGTVAMVQVGASRRLIPAFAGSSEGLFRVHELHLQTLRRTSWIVGPGADGMRGRRSVPWLEIRSCRGPRRSVVLHGIEARAGEDRGPRHGCRRPQSDTIVAPSPPSPRSPGRVAVTSGWPPARVRTASRSAPVPSPWMIVTFWSPASPASSR